MRSACWRHCPWLGQLRVENKPLIEKCRVLDHSCWGFKAREPQDRICVDRIMEPILKSRVRRGEWLEVSWEAMPGLAFWLMPLFQYLRGASRRIQKAIKLHSEFKTNLGYIRPHLKNKAKLSKERKKSFIKAQGRRHRLLKQH